MSTIKVNNIQHPSADEPAIVLDAAGGVAVAGMGLVHINTTSFTAVSSVSLNDVFTSAYDNYLILIRAQNTTGSDLNWRVRAGSDASGANYNSARLEANSSGIYGGTQVGQTSGRLTYTQSASQWSDAAMHFYAPFLALPTTFALTSNDGQGLASRVFSGAHTLSTSYDGISLLAISGNFTGTVRVYGYNNG